MVRAPVKKSGFGTTFLIWQNKLIRGGLENTRDSDDRSWISMASQERLNEALLSLEKGKIN